MAIAQFWVLFILRRYMDYPDGFSYWNSVSSLGSLISVVGVVFFAVIIWESLVRERLVIYVVSPNSQAEWINSDNYPVGYHTREVMSKIFIETKTDV